MKTWKLNPRIDVNGGGCGVLDLQYGRTLDDGDNDNDDHVHDEFVKKYLKVNALKVF